MSIIKQPNQLEIPSEIAEEAKRLSDEASWRWGVARDKKAQQYAVFMQMYKGWSPQQTYTSILNYGYSQVDDFLRDANETYGRMFERGIERELGQIANATNPAKVANSVAAPTDEMMAKYKETIKGGINSLMSQIKGKQAGLFTPEFYDKLNGAIASAASYFGKDFVNEVGGFKAGGSTNEIKVDYIGGVTGSSQPQTFKINPKTGQFEAGEITPIQSTTSPNQEGVDNLVDKVLRENKTNNLQQYSWWNDSPYKQEAYQKLQEITGSPEKLAEYVKSKGLTDLQNYSWWSTSPHKQEAWNLIQQAPVQAPVDGTAGTATTGATGTAAGTATDGTTGGAGQDRIGAAYDIINNSDLPEDIKALYRDTVDRWNPEEEINADKIIQKFNEIKNQTLDPYYRSLIDFTTKDFQDQIMSQQASSELELEAERAQAGQNIRQAKEGISQRGLTFSGEGVAALGAESAYARPDQGAQSAIPTQTPFGGMFYEGTVNQSNRLMASSNVARRQEAIKNLGKSIEAELGSDAVKGFGVNYVPSGGITGNLQTKKKQEEADTLTNLINQQRQNQGYQPIQYNF